MDKGLETLYHKLTNLLHTNPSTSSSSDASSTPKPSASLPVSTFFDRIIPSATKSTSNDRHRSSSRISRQISIKTDENEYPSHTFPTHIPKLTPIHAAKQQKNQ